MKYKVTLNGKTYEVEVEVGKVVLLDEYEACAPAPAASSSDKQQLPLPLLLPYQIHQTVLHYPQNPVQLASAVLLVLERKPVLV